MLALVAWSMTADPLAAQSGTPQTESPDAREAVLDEGVTVDWTGTWRTFWRGGEALMTLSQSGGEVLGSYLPEDGLIIGTMDGATLEGEWKRPDGSSGQFTFALGPDGQNFVGRLGNGEYWNGEKISGETKGASFLGGETPRAALEGVVLALGNAEEDDVGSSLVFKRLIDYGDGPSDLRDQNRRRDLLLQLIDMSTFRVYDAPLTGENGTATLQIGPWGTDWLFPLQFRLIGYGPWRIVAPPLDELQAAVKAALAAVVQPTYDAYLDSRSFTPRQVMADFQKGVRTWDEGGASLALATLDLSEIPEQLRPLQGPLAVEYLDQIFERLGTTVLQEIPNDPTQRLPFVFYEHAAGRVAIDRYPQPDGTVHWKFDAETIRAVPEIYAGIQNLPDADGIQAREPLTGFFSLRTSLRDLSPRLLQRIFLIENWQWIALALSGALAALVGWAISRLLGKAIVTAMIAAKSEAETQHNVVRAFGWPARLLGGGMVIVAAVRVLGLRQDVSAFIGGIGAACLILGGTFFLYSLIGAVGVWLRELAHRTRNRIDDIAVAVATGIAKVGVVIGGAIAGAAVLGLPYEGVIAGLGIGGLALAIAARDSVSNFIGAAILLADRPFQRGDLIEASGYMGTVEHVGLRSTQIRTQDDALLIVPNSKLADGIVNNWGRQRSRRVKLVLRLPPDTPRRRLDALVLGLKDVFEALPTGVPGATVEIAEFSEGAIMIEVHGRFRTTAHADFVAAKNQFYGDALELARRLNVEVDEMATGAETAA